MRNSAKYLLATAGICLLTVGHPAADSKPIRMLDASLKVTTVLNTGIAQPIGIVFLGANDFLVLEKASGQVKRVINGVIQATPVLDLAVNSASERGLLAMALHPNFPATPQVFIRWTESSTGLDTNVTANVPLLGNRIDRYTWNGSTLTFDRNILMARALQTDNMVVPGQPANTANPGLNGNHNGGPILFGPDGKLYVYLGDQGRRGWMQNLANGPFLNAPFVDDTLRRAGPRQRPPLRSRPAAEHRWQRADRQPVLRGRHRARRRGRREHPESVLLRPPQRLRDGVRSLWKRPVGDGERRRHVQ